MHGDCLAVHRITNSRFLSYVLSHHHGIHHPADLRFLSDVSSYDRDAIYNIISFDHRFISLSCVPSYDLACDIHLTLDRRRLRAKVRRAGRCSCTRRR